MKYWNWGFIQPQKKKISQGFCEQILDLSVAVTHLKGDAIGTTMPFYPREGLGWRMLFSIEEGMPSSASTRPLGFSACRHKPLCTVKGMVVPSCLGNARQVTSLCCAKGSPSLHNGLFASFKKGSEIFWWQLSPLPALVIWFLACILLFQHAKLWAELYSWVVMSEFMCVHTDL